MTGARAAFQGAGRMVAHALTRLPFYGLFRQRWQILYLIRKEFLASHRHSGLGLFWAFVMPMVPVTAYIVLRLFVAGQPDQHGIHPMVYVTLGVTLWLLFRDVLRVPLNAVNKYAATIANAELSVGGAVIVGFGGVVLDTLLRFAMCVPVLLVTSVVHPVDLVAALTYLFAGVVFFLSIGLVSIPLAVVFPDLKNVYDLLFTYLVFFSLAIFPVSPGSRYEALIAWNPFAAFIDAVRASLVLGQTHEPNHADVFGWLSLGLFVIAVLLLRRVSARLREAFL